MSDDRLNAAAPELLEACKSLVAILSSAEMRAVWSYLYAHNYKWTGPVVNLDEIRGLIARASPALSQPPHHEPVK